MAARRAFLGGILKNHPSIKKPDASPYVRMKVQPRTCSRDDRETPSKTQRHNGPLLVYFVLLSKRIFFKLGWFSYAFAEITDDMNTETDSRRIEIRVIISIYTMRQENQTFFCFFLRLAKKGRIASRGSRSRASENSLVLDCFFDRGTRTANVFSARWNTPETRSAK